MKKINYLIIVFLFATFGANAQITINLSDLPPINTTFTDANDTIYAGISIGNAGVNQTWNFSSLANHTQIFQSWVLPSTRPGASYFPTATMAVTKSGGQDSYVKISATAIEMLGLHGNFGSSIDQAAIFTPSMKYLQFPTTYQTSFNDTYNFEIKLAMIGSDFDSIKNSFVTDYSAVVDAWGTITTPAFSNIPCLRQKNTSYTLISGYKHTTTGWVAMSTQRDTTIEYIWISNQSKFMYANIKTKASGAIKSATYLLSTGVVGISESTPINNKIEVFPNPASDVININGVQQNTVLVIFDSNGKLMTNKLLNTRKNTINVSDYSNGMYFYQILDMKGQTIDKGRFSVVK